MPTNLNIDDKLLVKARRLGGFRTKRETVNAALTEFIARVDQRSILKHLGTIEFREDWDYKKDRRGRSTLGHVLGVCEPKKKSAGKD